MTHTRLLSILCVVAMLGWPVAARAGGSAPALTLGRVDPTRAPAGARVLAIGGSFNFDDLLQFSFPAGVIVAQGAHFVRYDLNGQTVEGDAAAVADGVVDVDIPPLLRLGAPAAPPARMMQLRLDRIDLALPSSFAAGPTSVILYAVLESDPFVSNVVTVILP